MRRMRVLRRLLRKYREQKKVDNHLSVILLSWSHSTLLCSYRELYMKVKGNVFKNKRVLMEYIHTSRAKETKEKQVQDQADALRSRNKAAKEKRMQKMAQRSALSVTSAPEKEEKKEEEEKKDS